MEGISVAMSVYKNDSPEFFKEALESILNQTKVPDEIILVEDGPIPHQLDKIISEYESKYSILNVIREKENKGLGNALRIAVNNAKYDYIARMDSDDISSLDRFEKQLSFLKNHPEVDIVGGDAAKFEKTPNEIIGYRRPKYTDAELKKQLQDKTPFCHVTIMAKKKSIIQAGSYVEIFNQEDYYLWARMAKNNCIFANIPDILVYVRLVGVGGRRGGWKYFKNEMFMQKYLFKSHIIGLPKYCLHMIEKFIVQVIFTAKLREWAYQTFIKVRN